ncbi:HNH endonuclease [Bacillus sp. mrc49]|uniref:HNH endonuclease n=1 Tax=Bacillus sp. mrc49 TaxID=2054913 RepID=UPI000C27102A|nr:HNH endonuclease [Bacillus sp. mrc49]PJN89603.1 HNH endonuclease [Bacillus sp. mrc49]
MRPIDKGTIPLDQEGNPVQLEFYQQSRGHLITRLGAYCSYCERYLGGNIAVEHIQPKSKKPNLELDWENFLIACNNCNSIKGNKSVILSDFLWPDKDNTSLAFIYISGGLITTPANLTPKILSMAKNTIKLTGLDRVPSDDLNINSEMKDRRWSERRTALLRAERANQNLLMTNTKSMRDQIVDTALATGFFSIWMTVFQHDSDMLQRFILAFQGTSKGCFDSKCTPINRPGGNI